MYKSLIVAIALVLTSCGGNPSSPPAPSNVTLTDKVQVHAMQWPAAIDDAGSSATATGYKVYCAETAGYAPAEGVDVGLTTNVLLDTIYTLSVDSEWWCSVAPYDETQKYARQGESPVWRVNGAFYKTTS